MMPQDEDRIAGIGGVKVMVHSLMDAMMMVDTDDLTVRLQDKDRDSWDTMG
jgi:hypothetical protein